MGEQVHAVNGEVLAWARQLSGLTVDDVARSVGKKPEDIAAWEAGTSWPTFSQLESLAETVYKRPVAVFFFPEPPAETSAQEEFRTLPDFEVAQLSADTRYAVRVGRAYQQSLRELTGGSNPSSALLTRNLRFTPSTDVAAASQQLREYLEVPLEEQMRWRGSETAMTRWRLAVERVGVYVFKRSFEQKEVSGFCLTDDAFPIVFINNSTAFNRQIFTLFHELAHLLSGMNSITTEDDSFVHQMRSDARAAEVWCNKFAAEFLVPEASFPWREFSGDIDKFTASISQRYNVSRETVLRRLLDRGLVSEDAYHERAAAWADDYRRAGGGGRGNYYATQVAYLGPGFLDLAFSRYRAGIISLADLSQHLGVRARYIDKLESRVHGGAR